ncbi:MAG TPA: hypothetical protein VKU80_06010 [Planctomycetota bacterium]|nr:hypothetical protein [Planctomycetota bacterium]
MAKDIEELAQQLGAAAALEIKTGVVRPGDTVIIGFNRQITEQENDEMLRQLEVLLPDVKFVAFPEVTEIRVYRPQGIVPTTRPMTDQEVADFRQSWNKAILDESLASFPEPGHPAESGTGERM